MYCMQCCDHKRYFVVVIISEAIVMSTYLSNNPSGKLSYVLSKTKFLEFLRLFCPLVNPIWPKYGCAHDDLLCKRAVQKLVSFHIIYVVFITWTADNVLDQASEYCLTVYLFLLLLIRKYVTWPLTLEKNSPLSEGVNTWIVLSAPQNLSLENYHRSPCVSFVYCIARECSQYHLDDTTQYHSQSRLLSW